MGVKVKIICDSISPVGVRLTTFEVEYPRIIHSEVMTHRALSRNAASSRAIPFDKILEQLTGIPSRFGGNQSGMQDNGEHTSLVNLENYYRARWGELGEVSAKDAWEEAKDAAIIFSKAFSSAGYHKQISNRLTEPFQTIKVLISATEWDNFFWLRCDEAADPTLKELADKMLLEYNSNEPTLLTSGDWHLPYITKEEQSEFSPEDVIIVSCARCAAVSYRNIDYSLEKCKEVYNRLVQTDKLHSSALEHCATPIQPEKYDDCQGVSTNSWMYPETWEKGISHVDRKKQLWSGNFKGFIQHRKTIKSENYTKEK